MEGGESIFDAIFDEDNIEDGDDVDMLDAEEGELVEKILHTDLGQCTGGDVNAGLQESQSRNRNRRRRKNRKNKKKRGAQGEDVTDINRFVLDTCRHLKERKSYLVWTAVGCLGVAALSDLVKEVDAIQSCGGQKTADGKRFRNGGGILWSILKVRDPNAYREIMKRGKEFEKQFKPPSIARSPATNRPAMEPKFFAATTESIGSLSDDSQHSTPVQDPPKQSSAEHKRASVHDRIRVPVSYDDIVVGEDSN